MLEWLFGAGIGPAAVALPVNWAAETLAGAAQRWFRRFRRTDDLSRLVKAATGASVDLTRAEFDAVRRLLEDQQTWSLAGRGTVEDLAIRIASCLPPRDGRTAEDSHASAMTITRGFLEFAVADLDPKLFQQLLLTRLQRMETDQASALDEALLDLHADLVARLAAQGELDAQRFADVMGHLKRVLEQLPPGPAQRGEIAVYLNTLIDWLSADPWPRDRRFGGPVLTPAAIERKLRITAKGRVSEQDLDADALVQQCGRLVIVGGPGSGKTWLARRTARRRAVDALEALAAGGTVDEVELPVYTTCSRLFGADGDIREAVVSSALGQLGDLGGSRLSAALRVFFTERNAPTVLVIDSLDEAHGSDERLRQADTLPWRIVLTSRPSSWNGQLTIEENNDSHRVGELQPLRYPDDVEPFIHRWFAQRPEWGNDLAAQIAGRPGLQQAATVPLILAFYCIIGGGTPLPEFRRDLYAKVLNRMLTGRWRGSTDYQPDVRICLQTLRAWAWSGATSDPVSGVGTWLDDILTDGGRLGEAERDALDHVATPIGPPDIDTGKTLRRFIHRSIREHLVAEHVAGLPVDQAAGALLPHIWFDADWEYAAPAALAMHPRRNRLLRNLICHAANSDQIPRYLSVIDNVWELRTLLARVAAESSEADWSPKAAETIGKARVDLAWDGRTDDLGGAAHWPTSNRQAREALLRLLAIQTDQQDASDLIRGLVQLDPTADDKRQAREKLLGLLAGQRRGSAVWALVRLATTAEDQRQVLEILLALLSDQNEFYAVVALVDLAAVADDKRQVRETLLGLLAGQADWQLVEKLVRGLVQLAATAEDKRQARQILLVSLAGQTDGWTAVYLAGALARLDPTAEDKRQARQTLLGLVARSTNSELAEQLAGWLVELAATAEDKRQARQTLLESLDGQTDHRAAGNLAGALARLDPTAEDKRQARQTLLGLMTGRPRGSPAAAAARALARLDPTAEDKRQARQTLLESLDGQTDDRAAVYLAGALARLDPTAEDKRQARQSLLGFLAGLTDDFDYETAEYLVRGVVQLAATADDKRQAREIMLGFLADQTNHGVAEWLVHGVVQLAATAEDKRQARETLLGLLAAHTDDGVTEWLVRGLSRLDPTADDKARACETVLGRLAGQPRGSAAWALARGLALLDPTADDIRQARQTLLGLLASESPGTATAELVFGLDELDPTVGNVSLWHTWNVGPGNKVLAAARRNAALAVWLAALPSLPSTAHGRPMAPDAATVGE